MDLLLYDTLSRRKIKFEPVSPPRVTMYCCGPTLYGLLHIGNFRGAVVFNFLSRWLKYKGYKVKYIYNFTDVDNKILEKAKETKQTMREVSEHYQKEFEKDYRALKLYPHDKNPKATDYIPQMIELVQNLMNNGHAYQINDGGDVFFHVPSFPSYGELSKNKSQELISGVRIKKNLEKKHPGDFALWKVCPEGEPGWSSPWGRGRPGWHLECTTMIFSELGSKIDIHAGGTDLIFPHHENELAQAWGAASGEKPSKPYFVKYWLHNNMFTLGGEKMAKSKGKLITMREFLQHHNGEIFKYMVLSAHYRSEAEFSEARMTQTIKTLGRVYSFLKTARELKNQLRAKFQDSNTASPFNSKKNNTDSKETVASQARENHGQNPEQTSLEQTSLEQALNDDLNTPEALGILLTYIRRFNEKYKPGRKLNLHNASDQKILDLALQTEHLIKHYGKLMSLFQEDPKSFLRSLDDLFLKKQGIKRETVDQLVKQRELARSNKDFKKADSLREQLLNMNIEVQDLVTGFSTWECKKT